jgi:hypothetical protein
MLVVAGAGVVVGTDVLVVAGAGVVVRTDVLVDATVVLVGTDVLVAATVVLGGVVSAAVAIDTDVVVSSRMPSTPAVPKHCEPFWAAERRHCDKASSYCVSVKLDVTHDNIAPHISLHGSKGAPVPSHTNVTGWYRARDGQ